MVWYILYIYISYVLAKSSALVIQLVNPCSCKRFKWLYTCYTNCESGILSNRLKKLNNDTWHDKLVGGWVGWGGGGGGGGGVDVVALTLNTQRIYRKKTRSNSCKPDLEAPHTSLPYIIFEMIHNTLAFLHSVVRHGLTCVYYQNMPITDTKQCCVLTRWVNWFSVGFQQPPHGSGWQFFFKWWSNECHANDVHPVGCSTNCHKFTACFDHAIHFQTFKLSFHTSSIQLTLLPVCC